MSDFFSLPENIIKYLPVKENIVFTKSDKSMHKVLSQVFSDKDGTLVNGNFCKK